MRIPAKEEDEGFQFGMKKKKTFDSRGGRR